MAACYGYTLRKEERICLRAEQERLFSDESRRVMIFPIRAIYLTKERGAGEASVKMMVSVPKRCFKRAVKRNRVKRQLREAYRHVKHCLTEVVERQEGVCLMVAFVWIDKKIYPSVEVNKRMEKLLCRLTELVSPCCVG